VITVEPRLVDVSDAVVATEVEKTVLSGVPADKDIDTVFKCCEICASVA
jgi:hypothetical protein